MAESNGDADSWHSEVGGTSKRDIQAAIQLVLLCRAPHSSGHSSWPPRSVVSVGSTPRGEVGGGPEAAEQSYASRALPA